MILNNFPYYTVLCLIIDMVLDSYMVPPTILALCHAPQTSFHYLFNLPSLLSCTPAPGSSRTLLNLTLHTHTLCSLCFSLMQLGKPYLDLLLIFDWDHSSASFRIIPDWSTSGVPTLEFWCAAVPPATPRATLNLESHHTKKIWVQCAVCPVNYIKKKEKHHQLLNSNLGSLAGTETL